MNSVTILLGLTFLLSTNSLGRTSDYICSKERRPTERWFINVLPPEDIEGTFHVDIRDDNNETSYLLFCENLPYYGNYTCHNSTSEAYEEGYVIFYPAPHYRPHLEIQFSNAEESTTIIHHYKCESQNEVTTD